MMNIKAEQVFIVLIIAFVIWCIYKNTVKEGFEGSCPGPNCEVTHNWPYIKQWAGRDGQRAWGDHHYNPVSHHPSVPSITNYDNRPYEYSNEQLAGFGCQLPTEPAPQPPQPTPNVPAQPLCMNCPSTGPACVNRDFQLPDLPLPQNHQDVSFLPYEGAPISEISTPMAIADMASTPITVPVNNGGNGDASLDQLPVPESGVIEELTDMPENNLPTTIPSTNNNILVKVQSAVSLEMIIAILIGLGVFWYFCNRKN